VADPGNHLKKVPDPFSLFSLFSPKSGVNDRETSDAWPVVGRDGD
jgi:hypothetical protein